MLSFASIAITGGAFGILFWGAVLFGGIQFVWGVLQWLMYQMKSPEKKAVHHLKVDVRVLLRSMLAVAAADGRLDEGEVLMINTVSSSLLGEEVGELRIRELFDDIKDQDFLSELSNFAGEVTPSGAELAIVGAVLVAKSDGEYDQSEQTLTAQIALRLGVKGDRLAACVQDAHSMYEKMIGLTA